MSTIQRREVLPSGTFRRISQNFSLDLPRSTIAFMSVLSIPEDLGCLFLFLHNYQMPLHYPVWPSTYLCAKCLMNSLLDYDASCYTKVLDWFFLPIWTAVPTLLQRPPSCRIGKAIIPLFITMVILDMPPIWRPTEAAGRWHIRSRWLIAVGIQNRKRSIIPDAPPWPK